MKGAINNERILQLRAAFCFSQGLWSQAALCSGCLSLILKTLSHGDSRINVTGPSFKSKTCMTGHLLGATGALEAIALVKAIETGVIPPTVNYRTPDPECDLNYVPNGAIAAEVNVAISNSFGFFGHNAWRASCPARCADIQRRDTRRCCSGSGCLCGGRMSLPLLTFAKYQTIHASRGRNKAAACA